MGSDSKSVELLKCQDDHDQDRAATSLGPLPADQCSEQNSIKLSLRIDMINLFDCKPDLSALGLGGPSRNYRCILNIF